MYRQSGQSKVGNEALKSLNKVWSLSIGLNENVMLQSYKSLKKLIVPTQDQVQAKPRLVTPLLRISIYLIVRLCQLRCQWHWFQCKRCECKHQALIQIFLKDLYQVIFTLKYWHCCIFHWKWDCRILLNLTSICVALYWIFTCRVAFYWK